MKIIFLDIDGVLNNRKWFSHISNHPQDKTKTWLQKQFEPRAVSLLNDLIEAAGAKIVVSSSWRIGHTKDELQKLLQEAGLKYDLLDYTPCKMSNYYRGNEIQWWLNDHPEVTSFVILDDNSDMLHLMDKLVKTSNNHGLQREHIEKAKEILGVENLNQGNCGCGSTKYGYHHPPYSHSGWTPEK